MGLVAYHSFKKIGVFNSVSLFYTAPAKTEDYNQEGTKLANIKIHILEETIGPWLWILDCSNMSLRHYTEFSFNLGLLQMLSERVWLGLLVVHPVGPLSEVSKGWMKPSNTNNKALIIECTPLIFI